MATAACWGLDDPWLAPSDPQRIRGPAWARRRRCGTQMQCGIDRTFAAVTKCVAQRSVPRDGVSYAATNRKQEVHDD